MTGEEFDEEMRSQPCRCCGNVMEPAYVEGEVVYQGGLLVQKMLGAKDGRRCWVFQVQALCVACLEKLQGLANESAAGGLLGDDPQGPFYFCGGEYWRLDHPEERYFAVCSLPRDLEQGGPVPYVAEGRENAAKLFNVTKHHGHLYELAADRLSANLIEKSHEAERDGVGAPAAVVVPTVWVRAICAVIRTRTFSGTW